MDKLLITKLVILIIHFGISILVLWLVYRLFKKLLILLKNPVSGTNNSVLNLFLSFGIALIFFNSTVLNSIYRVGRFFISPLQGISVMKTDIGANSLDYSDYLVQWIKSFEQSFTENILYLNYTGLFIFLTFWLLISLLFREIEVSIKSESPENRTKSIKKFTDNTVLKNLFVIGTLIISIYLCIASIVAVPEFQNLDSSKNDANVGEDISQELESQKLYTKENLLFRLDTSLKNPMNVKEFDEVIERLNLTVDEYNSLINNNWSRDEKAKKIVINRFKAAVDQKMGLNEKIKYKMDLTEWYLSFHESWTFAAGNYQAFLISIQKGIKATITNQSIIKIDTIQKEDGTFKLINTIDSESKSKLEEIIINLNGFNYPLHFVGNTNINDIPEKPQIGEKFGIFNQISGWLLRTESISLALIVGLFGFGLLGSIGSTFIRKRIRIKLEDENNESIVLYDLQGILINGISAAIVVFLAVKGTLVIFGSDGNTMNPYILFFTCLVAAVFSEDVWSWARKKLNDNLGNNDKNVDKAVTNNKT